MTNIWCGLNIHNMKIIWMQSADLSGMQQKGPSNYDWSLKHLDHTGLAHLVCTQYTAFVRNVHSLYCNINAKPSWLDPEHYSILNTSPWNIWNALTEADLYTLTRSIVATRSSSLCCRPSSYSVLVPFIFQKPAPFTNAVQLGNKRTCGVHLQYPSPRTLTTTGEKPQVKDNFALTFRFCMPLPAVQHHIWLEQMSQDTSWNNSL